MIAAMRVADDEKTTTNAALKCESIRCAAHVLNLVVGDVLEKDNSPLTGLRQRCRNIASHFNKSSTSMSALLKEEGKCGIKPKKIFQDVRTRWNSFYLMIERLLVLKLPLTTVLSNHKDQAVRLLQLSAIEWELMTELSGILKPIYQATTMLEGGTYPTLSLVSLLFAGIKQSVQKYESKESSNISQDLAQVTH